MTRYYCHEHPDVLTIVTRVVAARRGAVLLEDTPFYPGGGGQLADHGRLSWSGGEVIVSGIDTSDGRVGPVLPERGGPGRACARRAGGALGRSAGGGGSELPRSHVPAPHRRPHPERPRLPAVP